MDPAATQTATRPDGGTASIQRLKSSLPPSRRRAGRAPAPAPAPAPAGAGAGAGRHAAGDTRGHLPHTRAGDAVPETTDGVDGGGVGGRAAALSESQAARERLCSEVLVAGYVQSYVDLFYLTHRPDPNPDAAVDNPDEQEIVVPLHDMEFIRDNLCRAEAARRKGDTGLVFEAYTTLATHFQERRDPKTGVYFYEKCLEIARLIGDAGMEMAANRSLGLSYQQLGDTDTSIGFHERHLALAKEAADVRQEKVGYTALVRMYRAKADALEADNRLQDAVAQHLQCLGAAKACADRLAEGEANYCAGRTYVLLDQPEEAIPYLNNYLEISKEQEGHEDRQGAAYAALAAAHQKLHNVDKAVDCLERFLRLAKDTENLHAQAEAASNLGVIHNRERNFPQAVRFFEQAYELARSLMASGQGSRKAVDQARVNLGMARGNAKMGEYMNIINVDMSSLLQWKNNRIAFDSPLLKAGKK